ncbi:phosphoenolpyruvate carboxylase [Mucilaginibacter robiniae]|uniref:Phosphoenolpyruvate carboxylase n=1 Tax=Mucilaginibacter robiniae TaxID=2728022 RepID=A0A7L5E459_9SPHI|nr:phosphoenolpyruvate carboxylase [Mucilaginibacter robiniae]QJD98102.1 phosphoenolpyruvate carboxylase [Mucilaginibacter robiniae]
MSAAAQLTHREHIFNQEVITRFELYNSLFLTLPFYQVKDTGILLPFFSSFCEKETAKLKSPSEIIESFFEEYVPNTDEREHINRLFRFIQYIERQVVLFDAIEDSSFSKLNRPEDTGTLQNLIQQATADDSLRAKISEKLKNFSLRLVLTAHPTQFYPSTVLGIMTDLIDALKHNDINDINLLLQQLGKTPFFNKTSPTPIDEARSLIWFMENTFYYALASIKTRLAEVFDIDDIPNPIFELGFWPGGDRDGNPNVRTNSTQTVAATLRQIIFRCYYRDFRVLKRRITFRGVEEPMHQLESLLYENAFSPKPDAGNLQNDMLDLLQQIKHKLIDENYGIFVDLIDDLALKIKLYGCYFATLDIRQDSRILRKVYDYGLQQPELFNGVTTEYDNLPEDEKLTTISFNEVDYACQLGGDDVSDKSDEAMIKDTLCTIRLTHTIQQHNGEKACHRFIISNCQEASDILQLMQLFLWSGWKKEELYIDFMPLFETVNDLKNAAAVMKKLYTHPYYQEHLKLRGNRQMIMLGFSDSTKDGGYLTANWSIYQAKVELTAITKEYGIELAFFDGRGGPPARGGGKTHRFYAAMGKEIANDHIQLTIQGQTVSSQYGSVETAKFNIEQLVNAGITSALHPEHHDLLDENHKRLIAEMADESYRLFMDLRHHPMFTQYLENLSPLKLLPNANISSRPTKRNGDAPLKLEDLRAISFVTSWSQLKQNIPGFYGVGTALQKMKETGKWQEVVDLYKSSGFFKTMIDNCMMSMSKADFRITAHLAQDEQYGTFWTMLKQEFDLTKALLLELTGTKELMQDYPIEKRSIATRERIVLPLVIIQHFALNRLNQTEDKELKDTYSKLVIRTVYGVVNAGRNLV